MANLDLSALRPTGNLVLVHLRPGLQETPSGLIIPPQSQQITQHGDVIATGPACTAVSPGDLVLVPLHGGTHVTWTQNTPVLLIPEPDLLAILDPDDLSTD